MSKFNLLRIGGNNNEMPVTLETPNNKSRDNPYGGNLKN